MSIGIDSSQATFYYLIGFILAFLITLFATPFSKWLAFKVGAIDHPKERGMHTKPMPLAGGIAIVLGFIVTIAILTPAVEGFQWKPMLGLIIGGLIIAFIGLLDDIHNLSAKLRLFIQVFCAVIIVISGTTINFLSWPTFINGFLEIKQIQVLPVISIPLTIFWIVGITNAVNWMDGLDGLTAGIASIASICLMFLAIRSNLPIAIILTAALAGSCLGFLPHNFNPATIFMGDTGSTFLGFVLAVISIQGLIKTYTALTIIIAVLVLALPIFDTLFAILRRMWNGKSIMEADRGHVHHRLIDKGLSQKKAVLTLYCISGGFGIVGIMFAEKGILLAVIVLFIMIVLIINGSRKLNRTQKEKASK